jgi:D-inositol-3-phosphate glycosyltransferase
VPNSEHPLRVLYSFPHKIGASRICATAWYQVEGLAAAGAEVRVFAGSVARPLPDAVELHTTLAWNPWKRIRIPSRVVGELRACALHDRIVAWNLRRLAETTDVVHVWPWAGLLTMQEAKRLGIPAVMERANAHTRYVYEVVEAECQRLGIELSPDHEEAFKRNVLALEEEEYCLADRLLCPSDFVARTFVEQGFLPDSLARHQYGYDETVFYPTAQEMSPTRRGLVVLFTGACGPRKGLHYALDAWLNSSACKHGKFLVAGEFVPGYAELLSQQLSHPSVKRLGFRSDVASLMRESDVLVLPSTNEGSALVTYEARGSGCVLAVSDAAGAVCRHMENALVHTVGDVDTLSRHFTLLSEDRALLGRLRDSSLRTASELTWTAAGARLLEVYERVVYQSRENVDRDTVRWSEVQAAGAVQRSGPPHGGKCSSE